MACGLPQRVRRELVSLYTGRPDDRSQAGRVSSCGEFLNEADLPTKEAQARAYAWFPGADADTGRSRGPEAAPKQGTLAPLGLVTGGGATEAPTSVSQRRVRSGLSARPIGRLAGASPVRVSACRGRGDRSRRRGAAPGRLGRATGRRGGRPEQGQALLAGGVLVARGGSAG